MNSLIDLYRTIESRKTASPDESYVAALLKHGKKTIVQKFGEEAVETTIAAMSDDRNEVIRESADVLFHLLVLWASMGITPADVEGELERRQGLSGLAEKAARRKE